MHLQITGKNIDVGVTLREQVSERLDSLLAKYFDGGWSGQVVIEREGDGFRTECWVHLDSGIGLKARGEAGDAYRSFDEAADRLGKRLRRYKRRLKDHHVDTGEEVPSAREYTIVADEEAEQEAEHVDDYPVVIAETETRLQRITVGMAVMKLELGEEPVMVFRNVSNGRLNVVYRRTDGNIGWIDPPGNGEQEARG